MDQKPEVSKSNLSLWTSFCHATDKELYKVKKRLGVGYYQNYTLRLCPACNNTMGYPPTSERGLAYCEHCQKKFAWLELRNMMGIGCQWVECICPQCGETEKFFAQWSGFYHCQKCDCVAELARIHGGGGAFAVVLPPDRRN
jgi:hypothetical protein